MAGNELQTQCSVSRNRKLVVGEFGDEGWVVVLKKLGGHKGSPTRVFDGTVRAHRTVPSTAVGRGLQGWGP